MAEDDLNKIKVDYEGDEELIDFKLLDEAEEIFFATDDDPLLSLKPVVYTTKLDDMKTVKQDLTNLDAKHILETLHAESFPKIVNAVPKKRAININNAASYIQIARVVADINFKAIKHPKVEHIVNSQQHNQCKPCSVVLKDIKYLIENNQTVKLSTLNVATENIPTSIILEKVDNFSGDSEVPLDRIVDVTSDKKISTAYNVNRVGETPNLKPNRLTSSTTTHAPVEYESEIQENISVDPVESPEINTDKENEVNKVTENQSNIQKVNKETINLVQKHESRKRRRYLRDDSDEDDDVPLHVMKKKTTETSLRFEKKIQFAIESAYPSTQDKFTHIVLIHHKNASIYRVSATKYVTDYYIVKNFDDFVFASLYPKEEKIIEKYCCWYKREDSIGKICSRKNYPFIIQKFLKQPHECCLDDCHCCCRKLGIGDNNAKCKQIERRATISKAMAVADGWIRSLLGKNNAGDDVLISKALNYVPEIQKQVCEKQCEAYLNNALLCIKNVKKHEGKCEFEVYDIGKNGEIERSLLLDNDGDLQFCRRSYQSMSNLKNEIKAELCCWFKREKLMHELKILKLSPAALRHVQKPHNCATKHCSCCCKPITVSLQATVILPSSLKHTASYEKNKRSLKINFNLKSKTKFSKTSVKYNEPSKVTKTADASTAAVVLSEYAFKNGNMALGSEIMSKFKNLKLGVNSSGILEVVLDAPANTLTVAELKVLSDIIAFSTEQMTEFELSAKEFCNRINSKSKEPTRVNVSEAPLLRTVLIGTLQDETDYNAHNDVNGDKNNTLVGGTDPVTVTSSNSNSNSTDKTSPNKISQHKVFAPSRKSAAVPVKPRNGKSLTGMLSALSDLMHRKSKSYVDSFKTFFNEFPDSKVVIPEFPKINPEIESGESGDNNIERVPMSMPIIKETFTLTNLPSEVSNAIPGPSGVRVNRVLPGAEHSIINSQTKDLTNIVGSKLRVKPVSELIAKPPQTVNTSTLTSDWTVPIVLKCEPNTNTIVTNAPSTPLSVVPNIQNQTLLIPNNVSVGTTFKLVSKPLNYRVNSNEVSPASSVASNNGTRYLTLMPITRPTILSQSKNNNNVRPISNKPSPSKGGGIMPKLVPLLPSTMKPVLIQPSGLKPQIQKSQAK